jgi:hypothetical protein
VPPQPNCPPAVVSAPYGAGKRHDCVRAVFQGRLPQFPEEPGYNGSRLRSANTTTSQQQAAVKLHGVFSSRWETVDCASTRWLHRVPSGDSGALVDPFMRVGTYPTRHLATLRESELLPAFAGPYAGWTRISGTCTGQDSETVHTLSRLRFPVFLLNSQDPLVTATCDSSQRLKTQAPLIPKLRG